MLFYIMKVISTKEELIQQLAVAPLQKPNPLTSTKYGDKVIYNCGCKDASHKVNDPSNRVFAVSMPVKFAMECENGYLTFFQVKGFFKQTVTTFWSCKSKLFMDALKELGIKI